MKFSTLVKLAAAMFLALIVFGIVKCSSKNQGVRDVAASATRKKVFDDFQINDVAKIMISGNKQTVTLQKGKEEWEVVERDNYSASLTKVVELLRKLWDLEIAQPVALQRNHFPRVKLLDPKAEDTKEEEAAIILDLSDASGKSLGSIWLGKVHETSEGRSNPFSGGMMMSDKGRYVKRGDSNAVFIVSEVFREIDGKLSAWLDDAFFTVEKIKSISKKTGTPEEDWSLVREVLTDDFNLADAKEGEVLDKPKTSKIKTSFSAPRFDDVLAGQEATAPTENLFNITTFDGFSYEIATGNTNELNELPLTVKVSGTFPEKREPGEEESDEEKKKKDEEFAKDIEKRKEKLAKEKKLEGRVFKVRSFVVDSVSQKRAEILEEKVEEEPKVEVETIEPPKTGTTAPKAKGK